MEPLTQETTDAEIPQLNSSDGDSKGLSIPQKIALVVFGILSFLVFMVAKLPDARIQNFLMAHIRILAQEQGLSFSAEKIRIGIFLGPSIKFTNIELKSLENEKDILKIEYLKIRPNLLSLLRPQKSGSFSAELLGGEMDGSVGAGADGFSFEFKSKELSLGRATLLRKYAGLELQAVLNGTASLEFVSTAPEKTTGGTNLRLTKIALPPQTVGGFNLPKISATDAQVEIGVLNGQLQFRNVKIGKDIKTDDIVATLTGDSKIERTFERSRLNGKASLALSNNVLQALPLLDALMGPAKGPDGKYNYRITGTLMYPEAYPGQ